MSALAKTRLTLDSDMPSAWAKSAYVTPAVRSSDLRTLMRSWVVLIGGFVTLASRLVRSIDERASAQTAPRLSAIALPASTAEPTVAHHRPPECRHASRHLRCLRVLHPARARR